MDSKEQPAKPTKTPAGGQINADWARLGRAIEAFTVFVRSGAVDVADNKDWHVIFRCGTVARVTSADPEWGGYTSRSPHAYEFPEHRVMAPADTVAEIMADNALVWDAQRQLPDPVGKAVRQAFAKLVSQGYPYPGGPPADRSPIPSGVVDENEGMMWHVYWPNLDSAGRVFNLAFAKKGVGAVVDSGDLRRLDYMFPEVAAVLTPALALWQYGPNGTFAETAPALTPAVEK